MSLQKSGWIGRNASAGRIVIKTLVCATAVSWSGLSPSITFAGETACGCEPACRSEPVYGPEPVCGCEAPPEPACGFESAVPAMPPASCGCEAPTCGCDLPTCGCDSRDCGGKPSRKDRFMKKMGSMKTKFTSLFKRKRHSGDESCDDGCDAMLLEELSGTMYSSTPMYSAAPMQPSASAAPSASMRTNSPRIIQAPTPPADADMMRHNSGVIVPAPNRMQNQNSNQPQPLRTAPAVPRSEVRPSEMDNLFDRSNDPFADEASFQQVRRIQPASYRH